MATLKPGKQSPKDFLRSLEGANFNRTAHERGISVRALLEEEFPTGRDDDGMTPLARLMEEAGLVTRTDVDNGIYAVEYESFMKSDATRFLLHTYLRQVWDNAVNCLRFDSQAIINDRAVYESGDQPYATPLTPMNYDATPRYLQIAPQIPIEALLALTTPINGGVYQSFYLTDDKPAQRMGRVAQSAEIPRTKLTGTNHITQLHKYGRAIEFSYEIARRQRIDTIALHVARIAVQAEVDRVSAIIDVLVNGDGNANSAATVYNLTTLDSAATPGTLTLKAWLAFKLKFPNPYIINVALANEAMILQAELLSTGSANIPLVMIQGASQLGSFNLINPQLRDAVAIGVTADAPASTIIGFDSRLAIQRLTEVGGDITETERFITRQTQALVMSYVDGYASFDANAVRVLNVAA